jgi:hypothetical protein
VFRVKRDRFVHKRQPALPFPHVHQTRSEVSKRFRIIGIEADRLLAGFPEGREIVPVEQGIREHQLAGRIPRLDLDSAIRGAQRALVRVV